MKKIQDVEFETPADLLGYIHQNKAGWAYGADPEMLIKKELTTSSFIVNSGYGWFWIDWKLDTHSDEFFFSETEALADFKAFKTTN